MCVCVCLQFAPTWDKLESKIKSIQSGVVCVRMCYVVWFDNCVTKHAM